MAQTGFSKILTYKSDTATSIPSASNLTNNTVGAELAVNTADKRLFTKDSGGNVVELGTNPSSITMPNGTANGVVYANGSKVLTSGSALTFDGTTLGNTGSIQLNNAQYYQGRVSGGASTRMLGINSGNDLYFGSVDAAISSIIFTTGSEQMRLTSTGLGIGTSSPSVKLAVNGISSFYSATIGAISLGSKTNFTSTFENQAGGYGLGVHVSGSGNVGLQVQNFGSAASYDMVLQPLGGNLGLGVTPSAWSGVGAPVLQLGGASGNIAASSQYLNLTSNAYFATSVYRYINSTPAAYYAQEGGKHQWYTAPSGTAGNAISFTQAMTLDASGNLGVNTASPNPLSFGKVVSVQDSGSPAFSLLIGSTATADFVTTTTASYLSTRTAIPLVFQTGGTERMRIDSSGNVGIGTSSPGARLDVATSINLGLNYLNVAYDAGGGSGWVSGYNSTYSGGFKNAVTGPLSGIFYSSDGVRFYTNSSAAAGTAASERMRIDFSGNLCVGGTSVGGGAVVCFIANATTVPTSNPTGGGILYVQGGALKYRGSSGTITTIAAA